MRSRLTLLLLCLLSVSALAGGVRVGDKFPALDRAGLEGSVPSLAGKVVLVDFWATWCPPCRQSFPAFERLQKQFGREKFTIIAVSVDESPADLKRFLATLKPSFPTPHDAGHKLAASVSPPGMPTSYLLDRQGVVRFVYTGFHAGSTEKQLQSEITKLLDAR